MRHCAGRSARSRWAEAALALAICWLPGCTGLFQRQLPDHAAAFAAADHGALRAGFAIEDITPEGAPYLGGFGLNRRATGVDSRLTVRALVLVVGETRVALVGIDTLGLQRHDVEWIKSGIDGFTNGCVFLCSSHTHAAPDPIGLWGKYMLTSGRDRAYIARVGHAVRDAVRRALDSAAPARLVCGESRMPADGLLRNSNRPDVFDRRITILQARSAADEPIGSLIHFACHPEVLRRGDSLVSADFVGRLCDRWEAAGHGPAMFVNGALGAMISPRLHGQQNLDVAGDMLLGWAESALEGAEPVEGDELEIRRRDVYLPMKSWALRLARLTTVIPRHVYAGALRSTLGYLRIGDFEACCVPGEAEPGYARRIVAASGRARLRVFGLVDDEVGYLMSERDARDPEFAYERTMAPGPRAGEILLEVLVGDE
ncbi:MAG: neutral/alkaline non-lysosomal ceramidase N-terminal domain-containing protein [Planctomycetes bacterium]|nr:neutral/alkaline non-lysosomal ceramidase N-terminal domain-containing protein [Planctomycetota bacterium]